jgi:HAE1 family hydrophobic/amphiphilic exporter-1
MWISDYSIRNPVVTVVAILALVTFGALALLLLDTDEFPEIDPPVIAVVVPYPGAAPETVERDLVEPLEEAFSSISGVDEVRSNASDGVGLLIVEFFFEKNLQEASQDIRDKISETRRDLPEEIEEPILTRFDPNDLPIVSLALTSEVLDPARLTRLADPDLVAALRAIPGVAEVELVGGVERELTVEVDPVALHAAGLGIEAVVRAVQEQNLSAPVGWIVDDDEERTIRLEGRLATPAEFGEIVVGEREGRLVRLAEVARVRDGTEEPRTAAFFDGVPAVGIDVVKNRHASTTAVADAVKARLAALRETLPDTVSLQVVRDAGDRVSRSVEDVQATLLEGAALTVLVVFLFLASWRSTVITGLALPVSVLASFIAVWAFGFTLNTMSLLGLSLAIGILIDDAIVVRENIVRHMELGKDHRRAAHEGTAEIGLAVAATTFSIVVVFVPIAFMGGISEQWFAPFALTIACSVLVSLFVSFSLDPMLSSVWADPEVEGGRRTRLGRRLRHFNDWFDRGTAGYRRLIAWALRHPVAMLALALGSFALALALPAVGLVGSAFFPVTDRSEFEIRIQTPPGASVAYTARKTVEAARIARELPGVAYTYARVGGRLSASVDEASIYVRLVPKAERRESQEEIARALRDRLRTVGGLEAFLLTGGMGPRRQIQLEVRGPELDTLFRLAEEVAAAVREVPGAVDVGLDPRGRKPEVEVEVDRDLAAAVGVSPAAVARALRFAFAGLDAGDWIDPSGETREVWVRLAPEARTRPADLAALPLEVPNPGAPGRGGSGVPGGTGAGPSPGAPAGTALLPLGQVARIERATGPATIRHLDRDRVVVVEANAQGRPLNAVLAGIERRLAGVPLPRGYRVTHGGEAEDQAEVFARILVALVVAVLLMYLVLVVQFRSFLAPVAILASLPLSLIGVMLALLLTGSTLNLMSLIGVILLMGIVAKNAILLLDFARRAEGSGLDRRRAIVEAGGVRLRPIVMTSLAIIAGMIPVAIGAGEGGDFRAPLGRAVIGGVVTSTLLTLLVIPTLHDSIMGARDRVLARLRRRRVREPEG